MASAVDDVRLPVLSGSTDVVAWLRLDQTPGVGPGTARKLLHAFGLPENIFSASFLHLSSVVSERVARALLADPSSETKALIAKTCDWIEQPGNTLLTLADDNYPRLLLEISDPPIILYIKGRLELLSRPSIAVVGSRNATAQGISNAEKFSEVLSRTGLTIVSGMALGIDTAAHQGGLYGVKNLAEGSTVAVIGTGIDTVYPARNHALAHKIAEHGCIVSEYPLGTPAIAANFPRHNRIISGLSRGILVVEAAAKSGSLITARMALEQGRDVFAIPGSIHSPLSKGCHQLIKQGAKLVESAQDILEELESSNRPAPIIAPLLIMDGQDEHDDSLLKAIGFDPVDIDQLALRTGLDVAALHAQLLILELNGTIETLPGGIYRRLS